MCTAIYRLQTLPIQENSKTKSIIVLRTVAKFKAMGLEDESIIVSCVTDDLFLGQFEKLEQENDYDGIRGIVEEKIDKKIKQIEIQNRRITDELEQAKKEKVSAHDGEAKKDKELKQLESRIEVIKDDLRVFQNEFEKLKNKKASIIREAIQLEITEEEGEEEEEEEEEELEEIEIPKNESTNHKSESVINWQLLWIKLNGISSKSAKILLNVLSSINILVALGFIVVGCADIKNSQNYIVLAAIEPVLIVIFGLSNNLKQKVLLRIGVQAILFILFAIVMLTNYHDIVITLEALKGLFVTPSGESTS